MSDFNETEQKLIDEQKRKNELRKKQDYLWAKKTDRLFDEEKQREMELEANAKFDLRNGGLKQTELQLSIAKYLVLAKEATIFLNLEDFEGYIPMMAHSLIFVGARSGAGKTTLTANLIHAALSKGSKKQIVVITNEEVIIDVYNRVTCLQNGWFYTNHHMFSTQQIQTMMTNCAVLEKQVRVIDDSHSGSVGQTTSLEGIKALMTNLSKQKNKIEILIIDYYQNINHSKDTPTLNTYEVQEKFAYFIDSIKNQCDFPIIICGQVHYKDDPNAKTKTPFQEAIRGRKMIFEKATCAIELIADRENRASIFEIHKSRFSEGVGKRITVAFDKGMFKPYTQEWKNETEIRKTQQITKAITGNVFKPKEVK